MTELLFTNVHLATMEDGYGELPDAALAVKDGRIAWIGRKKHEKEWINLD
jgi:imidazolonepropionase